MPAYNESFLTSIENICADFFLPIEIKTIAVLNKIKQMSDNGNLFEVNNSSDERITLSQFAKIFSLFKKKIYSTLNFETSDIYKKIADNLICLLLSYIRKETFKFDDKIKRVDLSKLICEVSHAISLLQKSLIQHPHSHKFNLVSINNQENQLFELFNKLFEIVAFYNWWAKRREELIWSVDEVHKIITGIANFLSCHLYHDQLDWHLIVESSITISATTLTKKFAKTTNKILFVSDLLNYLVYLSKLEINSIDNTRPIFLELFEQVVTELPKNLTNNAHNTITNFFYRLSLFFSNDQNELIGLSQKQQIDFAKLINLCLVPYYSHDSKMLIRRAFSIALLTINLQLPPFNIKKEKIEYFAVYFNLNFSNHNFDQDKNDQLDHFELIYDFFCRNCKENSAYKTIYWKIKLAQQKTPRQPIHIPFFDNFQKNFEKIRKHYSFETAYRKTIGFYCIPLLIYCPETKITIACLLSTDNFLKRNTECAAYLRKNNKEFIINHVHTLHISDPFVLKNNDLLNNKIREFIHYILSKHFSIPTRASKTLVSANPTESGSKKFMRTLSELDSNMFPSIDQVSLITDKIVDLFAQLAALSQAKVPLSLNQSKNKKLKDALKVLIKLIRNKHFPFENTLSLLHSLSRSAIFYHDYIFGNFSDFFRIPLLEFDYIPLLMQEALRQHMSYIENAQVIHSLILCAKTPSYYMSLLSETDILAKILSCLMNPQSYLTIPKIDTLRALEIFSLMKLDANKLKLDRDALSQFSQLIQQEIKNTPSHEAEHNTMTCFLNWYNSIHSNPQLLNSRSEFFLDSLTFVEAFSDQIHNFFLPQLQNRQ